MHLIIDGYNLIRQSPDLQRLDARDLELGREALLKRLAAYRSRSRHQITVVFDGWQGGDFKESRDRQQGLAIIYSRLGERADEVIKRLLTREAGRALVVSSDRELQDCARRVGAAWINASQFEISHLLPGKGEAREEEEETTLAGRAKKEPARRLPKAQRRRLQRLKKL
jgi:predicted RNA-binding protein with PIN domain